MAEFDQWFSVLGLLLKNVQWHKIALRWKPFNSICNSALLTRWWWKALLLISILILNDGPVKKSISIWLWGGCLFGEAWQISDWILGWYLCFQGFPGGLVVKNLPAMQEPWVWSLGWEDTLEKEMATYSSILAWEIPWIEDLGRLQSMGLQKSQTWLRNWTTTIYVSQGRAWPWLVLRECCFAPSVYTCHCGLWWAFLSDGCYCTQFAMSCWLRFWASWSLIYLHESIATQDSSRGAFEKIFRVR